MSLARNSTCPELSVVLATTPPVPTCGAAREVCDCTPVAVTMPVMFTVLPASGWPNWSLMVTVNDADVTPSAGTVVGGTGDTVSTEVVPDAAGGSNVTAAVAAMGS